MSFQVSLENCQGLRIPDRGGKFIPPARNGEWKCSGTWFCASLWWHHEASLTSRSQVSGGDVDRHRWVEVGGCWACGCSKCKNQCLELDVSCYREPVQGDKERCDISPFGLKANHGGAFWIICKGLIVHDGSLARRASQSPSLEITRAWTRLCSMRCKEGPDLSDVVQCKPAGSSSFCNLVFESELVIENYPKISDWAWWGNC